MSEYNMTSNNVTVLMSTFNRSAFLVESIESLLAQSWPIHKIIVINDGSTDDTLEVLKAYEGRVDVVSKPNGGKAAALNMALQLVPEGLVWIFDDDDLALPKGLETLMTLLSSNPEANLAYGRHERFKVDTDGVVRILDDGYWRDCESDEFLAATLEDMFAHQPGMIVRKELYDLVGPFDETLVRSQDYDMLIRLARVATPVSTEEYIFRQRIHDGVRGTQANQLSSEAMSSSWAFFDKIIFRNIHPELKLGEYLGKDKKVHNPASKRHALIRRSAVMARKKLWSHAMDDLRNAAATSDEPLTQSENTALRRALASKYGCEEVLQDPKLVDELCQLAMSSATGSQIVASLARGLRWRVRSALFSENRWNSVRYFLLMNKLAKASSMFAKRYQPEMVASMKPFQKVDRSK
jgi:glycosyltransferase involved in cell wall biosynthesis|tara:strand:+ start:2571 stop:3797 length:1227 start_codon:yes stop_codon:yes gene_type:complete